MFIELNVKQSSGSAGVACFDRFAITTERHIALGWSDDMFEIAWSINI
jgi:hypothetical protein